MKFNQPADRNGIGFGTRIEKIIRISDVYVKKGKPESARVRYGNEWQSGITAYEWYIVCSMYLTWSAYTSHIHKPRKLLSTIFKHHYLPRSPFIHIFIYLLVLYYLCRRFPHFYSIQSNVYPSLRNVKVCNTCNNDSHIIFYSCDVKHRTARTWDIADSNSHIKTFNSIQWKSFFEAREYGCHEAKETKKTTVRKALVIHCCALWAGAMRAVVLGNVFFFAFCL